MELKKPLTFEEQLERLITHGVVVEDKDKALRILSEVNYYRLSGYALEYRKSPHDSDFIEDTTFERIYDLYVIDEEIRNVFRRYIEKIEVYCRTQIAYGFSIKRCLNPLHDQHYDSNNFYNKKGYQEVMEHFSKEKNYYNDTMVMKHHKLTYNNKMPLWVMVELMSLADISKLYSCMYTSEQKTIADNMGTSPETLINHLHCLTVLRNKSAHAARIYNTQLNPPAKLTRKFLKKYPNIRNNSLFAYTLVVLKRLPNTETKQEFIEDIGRIIEKYKADINFDIIGFPEDYKAILKNNI